MPRLVGSGREAEGLSAWGGGRADRRGDFRYAEAT
jgi:hypothetical protein